MTRPRNLILVVLLLAGAACGGAKSGTAAAKSPGDTLSRRQRDSTIGASKLPGAKGVQGALKAQDSAVARNARLDSVGR